ncbi:MAG: RecX family transcriptional regulator [Bacteroidaceae bacterium]|nr:RecX family transcriptional regulator [Bacteroidaceae bacterium]MDE6158527.1 RecX family transcriptional regulator [Bacteroidaceae bacterium]
MNFPKPSNPSPTDEAKALSKAAALCVRQEMCVSQIRARLDRWLVTPEAQERIIGRLLAERFIDEARFATAYARDKFRHNGWGPMRIDSQLRLLHIADTHRRAALDELPTEEQSDTLVRLLEKKAQSVKGKNNYERRGKLIRFALGRGFQMDEIMKNLPDDMGQDDEW